MIIRHPRVKCTCNYTEKKLILQVLENIIYLECTIKKEHIDDAYYIFLSVVFCVAVCQLIAVCAWAVIRLFPRQTFVTAIASLAFHGAQEMYAKLFLLPRLIADTLTVANKAESIGLFIS